jgi:hypothetical protein
MTDHRQRRAKNGGSVVIHPTELMASWIYDKKFIAGTQFMFGTLSFMTGEDDDLEHPTQEQEERRMTTIGFEFHQGLKNSVTTFQAMVRQQAMTNPIDGPTRLPIGTPSTTTRSFRLTLCEIRTTKSKESA